MKPSLLYKKTIDKNQSISQEIENVFSLVSAERISIFPGERKKIKTFIEIKIPEGFYGHIFPINEKIHKQGLYVFPDFIQPNIYKEIEILTWNINIPKSPLFMSDKERFLGDKNKIDVFIGDKIAFFSMIPITHFQIEEVRK